MKGSDDLKNNQKSKPSISKRKRDVPRDTTRESDDRGRIMVRRHAVTCTQGVEAAACWFAFGEVAWVWKEK
jgi:hypothetical protein